jgi:hypothetical protein
MHYKNMPVASTVRRSSPIVGVHTAIGKYSWGSIDIHYEFS